MFELRLNASRAALAVHSPRAHPTRAPQHNTPQRRHPGTTTNNNNHNNNNNGNNNNAQDGSCIVWRVSASGQCAPLRALTGHGGAVLCVAWSPDDSRLLTVCDDAAVRLWDVATGGQLFIFGCVISNAPPTPALCFGGGGGCCRHPLLALLSSCGFCCCR